MAAHEKSLPGHHCKRLTSILSCHTKLVAFNCSQSYDSKSSWGDRDNICSSDYAWGIMRVLRHRKELTLVHFSLSAERYLNVLYCDSGMTMWWNAQDIWTHNLYFAANSYQWNMDDTMHELSLSRCIWEKAPVVPHLEYISCPVWVLYPIYPNTDSEAWYAF